MKGLEALKQIKDVCECEFDFEVNIGNSYRIIEKELKAFEIMKQYDIDRKGIRECPTLTSYNNSHLLILTQEEFDLLKEVLKNE